MITTAEGVETEEQMRRLNLEGCIEVQGYLFSKPVAANEIASLLGSLNDRRSPLRMGAGGGATGLVQS